MSKENRCRHVQAFAIIGSQPFDCRGYLEQTNGKRRQFLEQPAAKGGNLLRKILKLQLIFNSWIQRAHQLFVDHWYLLPMNLSKKIVSFFLKPSFHLPNKLDMISYLSWCNTVDIFNIWSSLIIQFSLQPLVFVIHTFLSAKVSSFLLLLLIDISLLIRIFSFEHFFV